MPDISVIIVTYNSENDIFNCLLSLSKVTELSLEIIIIDNNSSDNTLNVIEKFKQLNRKEVKLIINKNNLGYTKANNLGIYSASGNCILLLNPDIIITENSLNLLYSKIISSNYSVIVPQLLNPDDSVQSSCRNLPKISDMFSEIFLLSKIFRKSRLFNRWKMPYFNHDSECEVEQPMAAAILIKSDTLAKINCFDERFIMFFNDVDLCKKLSDENFKILFFPDSKFYHKKGASIKKNKKKMIDIWNKDCISYFKKYKSSVFSLIFLYILLKITAFFRKISK
jgi:GT2 family glycosyltransferase